MTYKGIQLLAAAALAIVLSGCMKSAPVMGIPTKYPYISIGALRNYYKGSDFSLDAAHTDGTSKVSGVVISDKSAGNTPAGSFVIQMDTVGIVISLGPSATVPYSVGDSLDINFSKGTLVNNKGVLQVTGLSAADIAVLNTGVAIAPVTVTLQKLADNFAKYEATLVTVAGADLLPAPAPGEGYVGDKDLYDGSIAQGAVKLHTEAGAAFANTQALGNATVTGIPLYYNAAANTTSGAVKRLWPRNSADIANNSLPMNADLIVTGFLSDPRGSDAPVAGTVSGIVTHTGGYEYVQLMALRDIDFAATPYSLVIANNGTATTSGWANGGALTFKFNLAAGTAAKGTFVYVGGPSKVIAGYIAAQGKSTDISGANWVRTINYNVNNSAVVVGDGFGNSNAGLMGNSSPADGVAVFKGTTVTATTVPIDAVFYGTTVGTAYSAGKGYLIPANDHYNPVDPATGTAQPFFGQGTNTYVFAQPNTDVSSFSKLGGVVTTNAWISPRQTTLSDLPLTAQLPDIETAVGCIYFRK